MVEHFSHDMKKLPKFSLPASNGHTYTNADFASGTFVLYVYPKDMTPGCTIEAHDFVGMLPKFNELGVSIFGLSKDSLKSHNFFCSLIGLDFPLLSDEEHTLLSALDCWKEQSMFGKKYWGTERSTFVIRDGKIIKLWRKVKVPGHVAAVLDFVENN